MTLPRVRGLLNRGLAQGAAKGLRFIKPLADGEPFGPKVDEIIDVANYALDRQQEIFNRLDKRAEFLANVSKDVKFLLARSEAYGQRLDRLLERSEEERKAQWRLFESFGAEFELFGQDMVESHLKSIKVPYKNFVIDKAIPDPAAPEESYEVSLFAETPFLLGDCTTMLSSMAQVADFLAKVPLFKEALGRTGEEPRLYFFALHVNEAIKKEAMDVLDKASCLWYIDGEYSPDLIRWCHRDDDTA